MGSRRQAYTVTKDEDSEREGNEGGTTRASVLITVRVWLPRPPTVLLALHNTYTYTFSVRTRTGREEDAEERRGMRADQV